MHFLTQISSMLLFWGGKLSVLYHSALAGPVLLPQFLLKPNANWIVLKAQCFWLVCAYTLYIIQPQTISAARKKIAQIYLNYLNVFPSLCIFQKCQIDVGLETVLNIERIANAVQCNN